MAKKITAKWIKRVPDSDGSYWCYWKGKNGWKTTIADVYTLGMYGPAKDPVKYDNQGRSKYDRIVTVQGAGSMSIPRGKTEREARKAYGYTEALFWSEAIVPPTTPKNHRAKR